MCGIFCSLSKSKHVLPSDTIVERLQSRGPDSTGHIFTIYPECSSSDIEDKTYLTFYSTVLSLRGLQTTTQPFRGADKRFTLCWNGEAWTIDGHCPAGNDTEAVHRLLSDALTSSSNLKTPDSCADSAGTIANALSRVAGPYAFVFYDHTYGRLFFGRDFLGRRSLLVKTSSNGELVLSSVSNGGSPDGWIEVECDGIRYVDLKSSDGDAGFHSSHHFRQGFENIQVGLIPYNFAYRSNAGILSNNSVLPSLSLNRNLSASRGSLHTHLYAVTKLEALLRKSLSLRVRDIPAPPSLRNEASNDQQQTKVAVLFSGGLDCTILARLSHELLPLSEPIDLLNVAFENPRIHKHTVNGDTTSAYELCPDRITGRTSYAELQRVCPDRQWRFVAIDIPYSETQTHREEVISLMHPHNTEMDLSIANALYFAARGQGCISHPPNNKPMPYTTTSRVLLSGLGADELFAGYTRHATAFKRGGFDALLDELELDVSRLGKRNLGRDDRAMSHWGKEVRFPYLDEEVVGWALQAPVGDKCGFGEIDGKTVDEMGSGGNDGLGLEPEKMVLRCLALGLGMGGVAKEKKRAIQFGARTAKMDSGKTKGTTPLS